MAQQRRQRADRPEGKAAQAADRRQHGEAVARPQGAARERARELRRPLAERLLRDWDVERDRFLQICPKEMIKALSHPLSDAEAVETA